MNIFTQDGDDPSGITGLPGNEPNAVLHTSFSSSRSSTDGDSSTRGSIQSSAGQAFRPHNLTTGQYQGFTQQSHGDAHHGYIPPHSTFNTTHVNNIHPNIGSGINRGSRGHYRPNQQQVGGLGSFGAEQARANQIQPTQRPTPHHPEGIQPLVQSIAHHPEVAQPSAHPPIEQLQSVFQLQPGTHQPVNQQPPVPQPLKQLQSVFPLRPAKQPAKRRTPKKQTPKKQASRQPSAKTLAQGQSVFQLSPARQPPSIHPPLEQLQSVFQVELQPPNQQPESLVQQGEGTQSPSGASAGRKRKVAETQQLVDHGLSQSFDSTSPVIPNRLSNGGIICPTSLLSEGSNKRIKVMSEGKDQEISRGGEGNADMNNGKGNEIAKDGDESEDMIKIKCEETDEDGEGSQDMGIGSIKSEEPAEERKASMRANAPHSCGGLGEEITEEESAFAAKAQQIIDKDEARIKLDMQLNNLSIEPQPTADDAKKARYGVSKEEFAMEMKIELEELIKNEQALNAAEKKRASMSEEALSAFGIDLNLDSLMEAARPIVQTKDLVPKKQAAKQAKFSQDFFAGLSNNPEILMEVAKYMRPKDLVKVYSISKPFHDIISGFLTHTMQLAATTQAPESASIYKFKFYSELCTIDPAARPHPNNDNQVRKVPSPRWLQMVVHRDKTIRDILAMMAREGHRMPPDMGLSLKKMWLVMDVSTSRQRVQILHSPFFSDKDIYNMQLFFIKLDMRFNDPFDGPGNDRLRRLILGQRGLTPLCNLLKRKIGKTEIDITLMGIRYAYNVQPKYRGLPLLGIPPEEIGTGHLEGWGKGIVHLLRPDELVMREAVRRRLGLKDHIMGMMIWGYVNPRTGENIKVTDEEKYMSESESESEEYEVWNDDWASDADMEDLGDSEGSEDPKSGEQA